MIASPRRAEAVAALVTGAAWRWLQSSPAAGSPSWTRRNYRDREVSLLLGPAVAAGVISGTVIGVPGPRRGAVLAVAGAALVGGYDDRYGDTHARGLGGHLQALAEGRVTTGLVKLAALTATATVSSRQRRRSWFDTAVDTVLIAGSANLVNLFDLRPGRAAKATAVAATVLRRTSRGPASAAAAVAAGASIAALPIDLPEHAMLGDCGAAALGASLGISATLRRSRLGRAAIAAAIVGLTLASERVSFSAVIEGHPLLDAIDRAGRADVARRSAPPAA